jgi:hypothetical protein
MRIINARHHSADDLQREAEGGARFVQFNYVISLLFTTLKRKSPIYLIRKEEVTASKSWKYSLLSFLLGWWALPGGPRNTLRSISSNIKGGEDVTDEVTATVAGLLLFREAQQLKKLALAQ